MATKKTGLSKYDNGVVRDLADLFKPKASDSTKRSDVGIRNTEGKDISNLFEPTNGYDQINFDTGFRTLIDGNYVDIRYLFQRFEYTPRYEIKPSSSVVSEGETITINVTTTDVPPGTQVCYYTSSNDDFVDPTGTITIQGVLSGEASFNLTVKADQTTEGVETFKVYLKDCIKGTVLSESENITVRDTSRTPPTYSISTTSTEVNEGGTVTFNVVTTDVDDQEILYYTTSSNTDFDVPTGSVIIVNNRASFTLTVKNDLTTEGPETFNAYLKTDAITGPTVATSNTVTIKDTSRTPPTYTITPNKTTVSEGGTVTFNVVTTDVDDGTVLFYVASLTDDITPSSGSITIKSNAASFTVTVKEDMLVDPNESFTVALKTASTSGPTVKTSASVAITTDCFKGSTKLSEVTTNPLGLTPVSFGNFGPGRYVIEYIGGAHSLWNSGDRWLMGYFALKAGNTAINVGDSNRYTSDTVESKGREWNNNFNVFQHTGGDITLTMIDDPLTDNRIHPIYGAARYAIYDYTCGNPPTYVIKTNKTTVSEGDTITVTVDTTGLADGTVLFYNTTSDADFDSPSGQITIYGNTAQFSLKVKRDGIYETTETFIINLRRGSIAGVIAATSSSITILPSQPTYNITGNKTVVKEGESVIFTVTTTDVQDGTKLYYSTDKNDDFTNPTGDVTVNSNVAQFTLNVKPDLVYEGRELFVVNLRTGSQSGTIVDTSESITITDADATYRVTPSKTTVNEGDSIVFSIVTTDTTGTIYYDLDYKTTSAGDFEGSTSGSVELDDSGKASFTVVVKSDLTSESTETFAARIRTGSAVGPVVATSSIVTINDTSKTPSTYSISPTTTTANEGQTVTFNITTTNVSNGTTLYYDLINDTVNADDFTGSVSGSVNIQSNSASFNIAIKDDFKTEGAESFRARIRVGGSSGDVVATSASVNVSDTSQTLPTYHIEPNKDIVYEGEDVTFDVTTTSVQNGTVLYYNIPTGANIITETTDINIIIDGTSLDNATKAVIRNMTNYGVLKRMLLPLYNNNEATYTERVKVFETNSERTFGSEYLNRPRRNGTRVVNIAFQDESSTQSSISYQDKNNANYNADVPALRQAIANNPGKLYGIVFQVEGQAVFKTFLQGVFAGTGVFSSINLKGVSQIIPVYDVPNKADQLYYANKIMDAFKTLGIINSGQFNAGDVSSTAGTVTIQNNKGSFTITAIKDLLNEADEQFVANLGTTSSNTVASSTSVTIKDNRCGKGAKIGEIVTDVKTYNAASLFNSISKGKYVIEYVSGAWSPWSSGDRWLIGGFKVMSGVVSQVTGSGVVVGDLPLENKNDTIGQGDSANIQNMGKNWYGKDQPFYKIIDHTGGGLGLVVADDPLKDNRVHPSGAPKYAVYEYICGTPVYNITVPASVNEGESFTFTVNTTNVPDDTTLYFEGNSSAGVRVFSNDVLGEGQTSANSPKGSIKIKNNQGSATLNVVADNVTEGEEEFYIVLRTSHVDGPEVQRSSKIKINDTSVSPTYSIRPSVSEIDEGGSVKFNITTTNVPDGTQLSYSLSRTDLTPNTGTVTINSGKADFTVTASNDSKTEGYQTFTASLKRGTTTVKTSDSVGIRDTSTSSVNHKSTFTFSFYGDTGTGGEGYDNDFEVIGNTAGSQYEYYFFGRSYDTIKKRYNPWGYFSGSKGRDYPEKYPFKYNAHNPSSPCGGWYPGSGKWFYLDDSDGDLELNYIRVKNITTGRVQDIGVGVKFIYGGVKGSIGVAPTLISSSSAGTRFISYTSRGCNYGGYSSHWKVELDLNITI